MNFSKSERTLLEEMQDLYAQAVAFREKDAAEYEVCRRQYEAREREDDPSLVAIRPMSYEMVEAQISSTIPPIRCDADRYNIGRARNAMTLEQTIAQDLRHANIAAFKDEDERNTYIYGSSVWLVEWDDTIRHFGELGAPTITLVRPDRFFPQPGVTTVNRLEYAFIDFLSTVQETARKYGVPEDNIRINHETTTAGSSGGKTADEDSITVHVCFWRDDDGRINKYVWTDEIELYDQRDYYGRHRRVCAECGRRAELSAATNVCDCGGEIVEARVDFEELSRDIILDAGLTVKTRRVIPALSPLIRKGEPVTETVYVTPKINGSMQPEKVGDQVFPALAPRAKIKMQPTRIPWYHPDVMPIVVRKNTSSEGSIFGQSDMTFIRPLQQEYDRVKSRIYEKLVGASVHPVLPINCTSPADNSINKTVVYLPEGTPVSQYGVIDTTVSISQDLTYLSLIYEETQRTLGITNAYVGAADTTAKSGKAKMIQINQSAGRLESKRAMCHVAFCELAKILFQLRLAFSDEPVPVRSTDEYGMAHFSAFNRYDYVEYDIKTGQWYYDDRYSFRIDATADLENQPEVLWQQIFSAFSAGLYGNPQDPRTLLRVWQMLQRAHYPFASEQLTYLQGEMMRLISGSGKMNVASNPAGPAPETAPETAEGPADHRGEGVPGEQPLKNNINGGQMI